MKIHMSINSPRLDSVRFECEVDDLWGWKNIRKVVVEGSLRLVYLYKQTQTVEILIDPKALEIQAKAQGDDTK